MPSYKPSQAHASSDTASEFAPAAPRLKATRRKPTPFVGGAILTIVLAFLWWIGVFGGNVREIVPGRFYRSAQLSGSTLEDTLRKNGIRSVVNLRGPSRRPAYRSETTICRKLGIAHYDVSFSSRHLPKPTELRTLLEDLDRAPRPIMVHCEGGSDRAGMTATLYENVYEGVPLDRAQAEQLTWRYGHFPLLGSWPMDRFFDLYRETSRGQDLRSWIVRTYPAIYAREVAAGGMET